MDTTSNYHTFSTAYYKGFFHISSGSDKPKHRKASMPQKAGCQSYVRSCFLHGLPTRRLVQNLNVGTVARLQRSIDKASLKPYYSQANTYVIKIFVALKCNPKP